MESRFKEGVLTIAAEGRIDTNNAGEVQNRIEEMLEGNPTEAVTVDLEKLDYISSAGLRVLLRLRKAKPGLRIINVQPAVYEIFETTGFTEMMDITKGFRQVDLNGCEIIGEGSNGTVYRQDSETVVKVYKEHVDISDIERERELARTAFIRGIPTAISFDIVKCGGHLGSVFELLNARSISKRLMADSSEENLDMYAQIFADVLKTIHAGEDDTHVMPSHKETALKWTEYLRGDLPADSYEKLYSMVEAIPEDYHILHGDYHSNNVLIQEDGEPVLIDMDTLSHGDPIFEWGSIYNAYIGFAALDHAGVEKFLKIDFETARRFYLKAVRKYWNTSDEDAVADICGKAKLMGDIRLLRRTLKRMGDTEEGRKAADHYRSEIIGLLNEVDDFRISIVQGR